MPPPAPIAALRGARYSLGGAPLFMGVDLALSAGQRLALVGRNGAGKSTLMRMLAGEIEPDSGEVFIQPGTQVCWLGQEPDFTGFATALAYVADGLAPSEVWRAEAQLDQWGIAYDLTLATASGGQARRVALARVLAQMPDVLMLDEPTNHLDIAAIEKLETELLAFRGAVLVVSHDRRFLETISTSVAWLRQGVVRLSDKGYAAFEAWAEEIEAAEEKALDRLDVALKAEERWLARGVTARRRRNMGRVRKLMDLRAERRKQKAALTDAAAGANLAAETAPGSSRLVIEAKGVCKSFDGPSGRLDVINDLNLRVMRGDRLGIVGPNGAGKTTLLQLLLGQLAPDAGQVRRANNLEIAFLDQSRARLDPQATLWDTLTPLGGDQVMVRGHPKHVAAYAKDFMFDSRQLRQPVRALSGGERNRLTLAMALAQPCNLLVLDEPTNDLDIETLELLEDMLAEFDGTLLLVSHDRAFMDAVVSSVLTPEGGGRWLETPGGYSDYVSQCKPAPPPTARPATTASPRDKSSAPTPAKPAAKLSYKDLRRLEELDRLMPVRQAEIADLEARMADSSLFARDLATFERTAARLAAARDELERHELEWLELEERREALSRG